MNSTAEGKAAKRRGFLWFSRDGPLYDYHLMSEFKKSDPLHADILQNSVDAKLDATGKGCIAGQMIGLVTCGMLNKPLTRTLPVGCSPAQLLVRVMPTFSVCMIACSALGAHIGDKWREIPHQAEAKFHDWLKNRSSSKSSLMWNKERNMSATAEETAAKKGFYSISPRNGPLYDYHLVSEFKKSDPLHADILQNSIDAKCHATVKGCFAGEIIGFATYWMINNRLTRTLPLGCSPAQLLVRVVPTLSVCMIACSALGAHIGNNWEKIPHQAEAKFHDWFQNRSPAGQS